MKVIYTAVTNNRDSPHAQTAVGWSKIAFTDGPCYPGWECRPVSSACADGYRNAKIHKILTHEYLPDANYSLWIDGNIDVSCDIDVLIDKYLQDCDVAFHQHPERTCIYDEAKEVIRLGKDIPSLVQPQMERYETHGYPAGHGLIAGGVILRRHTETVRRLNIDWWSEIQRGSCRDQLSFNYVAWALDVPYAIINSHYYNGPLFTYRWHGS